MSSLKVLETNILHASDVIFWLDGTTAETPSDMLRIAQPLALQLTTRPRDLLVVHGSGKTAFMRRPGIPIINGSATAADKQRLVQPTFAVAGIVSDPEGRYIPRRFSIVAGNGVGHGLVVYPTPLGTRISPAGGLIGTLRFNGSNAPVSWARLTLVVTNAVGSTLSFCCQASKTGDFMLPLNRLPPLPEGIDNYSAQLRIEALAAVNADNPIDPADLVAMDLGEIDQDNQFSSPIGLTIVPGELRLIRSSNRDHVAVQPC
ncbi:hypothetical protein [uncultured Desulfobulbus sp.]|uniref:hypothetical protein n=1 Tax=uncultured Desulfobulbus sp. TaxID=239745 RepID=UPI0029C84E56|nr:hypothetical protein [uncultured Desulfobulbus sp.]